MINNIKKFFSNITKNILFGLKLSFKASKKFFLLKIIILLFTTVVPIFTMWIWKEILNGVTNFNKLNISIITLLIIYLLTNLLINLVSQYNQYVNTRYSDELIFYIEKIMIDKTSKMDLSFFDSASMGDKIRYARSNFGIMTDMTWLVFDILSEMVNIIITFIIISKFNLIIGFITVFTLIPYMIYNKKRTEKLLKMEKEQIRDNRKKEYFAGAFFDNTIQFEIKLNNIGKYFIEKYNSIWNKLYKINKKENIHHNVVSIFLLFLNISSELFVLVASAIKVLSSKIGIGDLQYNINIVVRLRDQVSQLITDINTFMVNNTRLNELQEFLKLEPIIEKSGVLEPSKNPIIEFCNVSFKYPNSDEYVLKGCSFKINSNEKTGIIGLNGAGKSTIIKLIFRFYDPLEGVITLDGIDLKDYDVYKVRKIFSILFQEYVTYCLPLREIIALSDFNNVNDDNRIKNACDLSGVSDVIKDWPEKYDSVLGRYYADNGKDLSGGQWQLVGLARAYFKESKYMILDEPSASLDPISEDRIFKQLYNLSNGKSCITISHRLSNTVLADNIIVIENGKIIEHGSHSQLLKNNGRYAYLFNLQAKRYL